VAINHHAVHLALRNRVLSALPTGRAWENVAFTPTPGQPFVEEDYVPATSSLLGLLRGGTVEDTGMYILRWYGVAGQGAGAMNTGIAAVLALVKPGDTITATDGTVVHIRGDVAPTRGQIMNIDGWAMAPITIPFRVYHQNPA
jgi:hypothetical protein